MDLLTWNLQFQLRTILNKNTTMLMTFSMEDFSMQEPLIYFISKLIELISKSCNFFILLIITPIILINLIDLSLFCGRWAKFLVCLSFYCILSEIIITESFEQDDQEHSRIVIGQEQEQEQLRIKVPRSTKPKNKDCRDLIIRDNFCKKCLQSKNTKRLKI
ncbi:uncharacterized protein NDAI_0H00760 [Naumovozyma dairenensis CBS 421]|uniref:Uncharacterized protein n=1 Tax=Naumovozyma dairenensis (strain ATCC 10597 / BCRC 20456 / CBS 421 / NBRC 0211 / NRRL Y-12639) TaxID=1071378 RepID=G0WEN9_NAUDC|nr:hypothetical protein NDAI_0H00760 [Naumovozyma dairenensis CBS 421]CCD26250.1 hypothetical protein NDAI_0H00760 [Naumovozyma dairenensis CBS 421]